MQRLDLLYDPYLFYQPHLIEKVDFIIIGGAMANTFLLAKGIRVGRSLVEESLTSTALRILKKAEKYSCEIILPIDLVVAKELSENIPTSVVDSNKCPENCMILDAGPLTVDKIKKMYIQCQNTFMERTVRCF